MWFYWGCNKGGALRPPPFRKGFEGGRSGSPGSPHDVRLAPGSYPFLAGRTDWHVYIYRETKLWILVLANFGSVFGQSWARDRFERLPLETCCVNHRQFARGTDYEAISWAPQHKSKIRPWVQPSLATGVRPCKDLATKWLQNSATISGPTLQRAHISGPRGVLIVFFL